MISTREVLIRHLSIVSFIWKNNFATVAQLAEHFEVSEDVIRSDLSAIQTAGDTSNPDLAMRLISLGSSWLDEEELTFRNGQGTEHLIRLTEEEMGFLLPMLKDLIVKTYFLPATELFNKLKSQLVDADTYLNSTYSTVNPMLDQLQKALSKKIVKFKYKDSFRKVIPQKLRIYATKYNTLDYYLHAYDLATNNSRVLNCSLISKLTVLNQDADFSACSTVSTPTSERYEIVYYPEQEDFASIIPYCELIKDSTQQIRVEIEVTNFEWFSAFIKHNAYRMVEVNAFSQSGLQQLKLF